MMTSLRIRSLVAVLALTGHPDEGQWLPQQVLAMDWAELQARGLQLTKDQFWHPENGGVLSAAVQIGGCSASFVSADGLLVTNHHCGFSAVQNLSTVENNLLENGFAAPSRDAEPVAPGMTVFVMRRIEDVTDRVHAAQARATSDAERWQLTQATIAELVREGEKAPNTTCHVASFLEGQRYSLYHRTKLDDVRLVYAPPRAIGEFGGEVDNWEWPRHTGDFAFFRAYVAPDGTPRPYHKDNVPYQPAHWLRVSRTGVREGDLVMVLGYPGQTERYLTSVAAQDRQALVFPLRLRVYTAIVDVLERVAAQDRARGLALAGLIKSLANVQKNAQGMVEGLARNGVVARKLQEEAGLEQWIGASPERLETLGSVVKDMLALDQQAQRTLWKEQVLGLLLSANLPSLMPALVSAVSEVGVSESEEHQQAASLSAPLQARLASEHLTKDLEQLQQPILAILLDEARRLPEDQRLAGTEWLTSAPAERTTHTLVAEALARTGMRDPATRLALFASGRRAIQASDDPIVQLARGLASESATMLERRDTMRGRRLVVGRRWIEAQERWRGKSFYPDANSTLRVSIASVKSYAPRDGVRYTPHTTVGGVLAKQSGVAPFASPKALLAAAANRASSRFVDAELGDVPVCFLSDGDTTGGNSGSGLINGRGELVGLNFDRVFENVAGDFGWRQECSRNIAVDVRFVLWVLEQVMPAPQLLAELGV